MLAGIGSVGIIAVLYFLVITDQKAEIDQLSSKISALGSKRDVSLRTGKRGRDVQSELEERKKILEEKQVGMPRPQDDHVWFLRIMEEMRPRYGLDLEEIRNPEETEAGVLPKFPYRAVALNVSMLGNYNDFGRFLADFENRYPYMRVQLTSVSADARSLRESVRAPGMPEPAGAQAKDSGKLRFNYRVIALIRSQI